MEMTLCRGMDVDVDEARPRRRVVDGEARLLTGLAEGGMLGCLAGIDVPTGLEPSPEAAMQVQHRAPASDDDRRRGHVHQVGVPVARSSQPRELLEEALLRDGLAGVGRDVVRDQPNERVSLVEAFAAVPATADDADRHAVTGHHRARGSLPRR